MTKFVYYLYFDRTREMSSISTDIHFNQSQYKINMVSTIFNFFFFFNTL